MQTDIRQIGEGALDASVKLGIGPYKTKGSNSVAE